MGRQVAGQARLVPTSGIGLQSFACTTLNGEALTIGRKHAPVDWRGRS